MSYIIGKPCDGVCDTACVAVCPVDCIHGPIDIDGRGAEVEGMSEEDKKAKMLYINPAECIDCGACIPECPVEAIYPNEEDAIEKDGTDEYVKKNYNFFGQEWK
jgi:ferredoxin